MVVPLSFGWRDLLFANWPVDAEVLDEHLPEALSVQTYDGTGWLTVLPFVNVDVRPRGLPPWAGPDLPELNLRTYVTCDARGSDDVRRTDPPSTQPQAVRDAADGEPGIYFFSLDVQGLLPTLGARLTHRLPYYYARIDLRRDGNRISFESRRRQPGDRPATFSATYGPAGEPFEADPGSLAEFLTERRRLFTQGTDGSIRYTDVEHDRYTLHPATASVAANTLFAANGFDHPETEPTLYYSPGVDVVTSRSHRWPGGE